MMIEKLNKAMSPENQAAALACAKRIQAALGKEPLIVAFAARLIEAKLQLKRLGLRGTDQQPLKLL